MFAHKNRLPKRSGRQNQSRSIIGRFWVVGFLVTAVAFLSVYVALAAISLSTSSPYTQSFDGMGTPANTTTASTLPVDFRIDTPGTVRTVGTWAAAGTSVARAGGANPHNCHRQWNLQLWCGYHIVGQL
jgi:hypothetical protein